jgi:hypothetical protein
LLLHQPHLRIGLHAAGLIRIFLRRHADLLLEPQP